MPDVDSRQPSPLGDIKEMKTGPIRRFYDCFVCRCVSVAARCLARSRGEADDMRSLAPAFAQRSVDVSRPLTAMAATDDLVA